MAKINKIVLVVVVALAFAAGAGGTYWYMNQDNDHIKPEKQGEQAVEQEKQEEQEVESPEDIADWEVMSVERWGWSLKYPPSPYCGDSEVSFICLEEGVFTVYPWGYAKEDNEPFTCGKNLEGCVAVWEEGFQSIEYKKHRTINNIQGYELMGIRERADGSSPMLKIFITENSEGTAPIVILQDGSNTKLNNIYEKILTTIEP